MLTAVLRDGKQISSNWYGALPNDWAGELTYPNRTNFDDHFNLYCDMVEWIVENIDKPRDNVLWNKLGDCIYVQFRKKQDMTFFILKWGNQ